MQREKIKKRKADEKRQRRLERKRGLTTAGTGDPEDSELDENDPSDEEETVDDEAPAVSSQQAEDA